MLWGRREGEGGMGREGGMERGREIRKERNGRRVGKDGFDCVK